MVTFLDKLVSNYLELISGDFRLGGQLKMQPLKVPAVRAPEESGEDRNGTLRGSGRQGRWSRGLQTQVAKCVENSVEPSSSCFFVSWKAISREQDTSLLASSQGKEFQEIWKLSYRLIFHNFLRLISL